MVRGGHQLPLRHGVLTADDAVSGTAFGLDLAVSQKDLGNWLSQCAAALNNGSINMIAPAGGATRAEMAEQVYNDYYTILESATIVNSGVVPFTDIDGCTEAQKTAIEFFYRRGIISGTTETTFTPYAGGVQRPDRGVPPSVRHGRGGRRRGSGRRGGDRPAVCRHAPECRRVV